MTSPKLSLRRGPIVLPYRFADGFRWHVLLTELFYDAGRHVLIHLLLVHGPAIMEAL